MGTHQYENPVAEMETMRAEWIAWQRIVHELDALNIDINEERFTPLAKGIELWGEELSWLRSTQSVELCNKAHQEKLGQYERCATPGFEAS